jgi:hypothetical protein
MRVTLTWYRLLIIDCCSALPDGYAVSSFTVEGYIDKARIKKERKLNPMNGIHATVNGD